MDKLTNILNGFSVDYADFRIFRQRDLEVALRHDSFDIYEYSSESIIFRTMADGGYGVASTDDYSVDHIKEVCRLAIKQARMCKGGMALLPIRVEQGEYEHPIKKGIEIDEVCEFLRYLEKEIRDSLSQFYTRSELIFSYHELESDFITSEGSRIRERKPLIEITLYVLAKDHMQGYSSEIVGGMGGYEVILQKPWDRIVEVLVKRAESSSKASASKFNGERLKVILDHDGAGAIAHEVAHMLEADTYQKELFANLNFGDLEIVDDPTLSGGYGSFHWDDEGVKSVKKRLISKDGVNLLHTRLTAKRGDVAGNAHGITHKPRPMISNVFIRPSDWRCEEIFEDTRHGVYAEGIVRAEGDVANGRIEIVPEIAYLIEKKQITKPIRSFRIVGHVSDIQRIDAIGEECSLRPNVEKGYPVSEGSPYIRIDGINCY
ncbi:MAG: TldD/PmbA family protein [Nitrososphaerales archaeon]|nr:TldD/PmbA family protein [Nitrososphaerales archaeon]